MNVASRMETTGTPNKIQMSTETANLLIEAGKSKWVVPRPDVVLAKGKGELRTFWFKRNASSAGSVRSLSILDDGDTGATGEEEFMSDASLHPTLQMNDMSRTKRLIDYNVEVLAKLLHQIVIRRASYPPEMSTRNQRKNLRAREGLVIDEVKDIVDLPQFDVSAFKKQIDPDSISISPRVHEQLVHFVTRIADLYRPNAFHSFEHASHVTQSVTKLLGRITNPADIHDRSGEQHKVAAQFHDHTFGISSDPLTQLAVVLSALIHDA
jgi:Adenylate and Guanylate cyclase catalytic domain